LSTNELEHYKELNKGAESDSMSVYKTKEACLNLLDLCTLNIQTLFSCDPFASYRQGGICTTEATVPFFPNKHGEAADRQPILFSVPKYHGQTVQQKRLSAASLHL
jgi:hypothetical protein